MKKITLFSVSIALVIFMAIHVNMILTDQKQEGQLFLTNLEQTAKANYEIPDADVTCNYHPFNHVTGGRCWTSANGCPYCSYSFFAYYCKRTENPTDLCGYTIWTLQGGSIGHESYCRFVKSMQEQVSYI